MRRILLTLLFPLFLGGCHRHAATPEECRAILSRIVELELHELGFRDPALSRRKAAEAQRVLGPELTRCVGVRVRDRALSCVQGASSTEEISHHCLR